MTMTERSLQQDLRGTAAKSSAARRAPRYWFPAHRLAVVPPATPASATPATAPATATATLDPTA